jgi:hypothetical protein
MTRPLAVALAATAVALAGAPALAAPAKPAPAKPTCRLVIDDAGDAVIGVENRDSIDILSADVASGAKNVVGVLRIASLGSDPALSAGASYSLSWRLGSVTQSFSSVRYSDGSVDTTFDPNTEFGASGDERPVAALLDTASGTITWTVPRKSNPALKGSGMKFTGLSAVTQASFNIRAETVTTSGSFLGGDEASTGKSYVDRSPTCVKGV